MRFLIQLILISLMLLIPATAWCADAQPEGLIDVVVSGTGRTESEATKDALANAVRQAIGVYVNAETLVKNDEVVNDQIIAYSNGFVERFDAVGKPRTTKEGLTAVTVKASVRRTKLVEKLKAVNIAVTPLDGKNLLAVVESQNEQKKTGAALIAAELKGMPMALIKAEVEGKINYDNKAEKASVPIRVSVNQEAYKAFVDRLLPKLKEVSAEELRIDSSAQRLTGGYPHFDFRTVNFPDYMTDGYYFFPKRWSRDFKPKHDPVTVFVCETINASLTSSRWRLFFVSPEITEALGGYVTPAYVEVLMTDSLDSAIATQRFHIATDFVRIPKAVVFTGLNDDLNNIIITPTFHRPSRWSFNTSSDTRLYLAGEASLLTTLDFSLSPDELKRVAKVVCSVKGIDKPAGVKKPADSKE